MVGEMKHFSLDPLVASIGAVSITISLLIAACTTGGGYSGKAGSFASARKVIESNCVHCHGDARLANMPAFNDTHALANLTGPGKWIVPGHPEHSRFFQVVMLADEQPGAMPPTGHAISKAEAESLRAWIQAGATLPEGAPSRLAPRGEGPRSR